MYIICRATCISKQLAKNAKPKYRKFKDTFVNVFSGIELATNFLKNSVIKKENLDLIDIYVDNIEDLRRKYNISFLENSALFVVTNKYGRLTTFNIYYMYKKNNDFEMPMLLDKTKDKEYYTIRHVLSEAIQELRKDESNV